VASPRAIAEAAVRSDCRSVAFTFLEYAVDVAQACREGDIKTVAVSAGYICAEPRLEFFRHVDAANIDLKELPRASTSICALAGSNRCLRRWNTSSIQPMSGSRSLRC
jgi:pyruvate-formate lyase-activating enzyme